MSAARSSDITTTAVMAAAVIIAAIAGSVAGVTVASRVARPATTRPEVRQLAEQAFALGRRVERNQRTS